MVRRLGIDYETLKATNPGIIYCSLTGYGQTGPCRDRVGHDVNFLARSGLLDLIGDPQAPPAKPDVPLADFAGGLNAATAILLALIARPKTGRGQYIDLSITDTMLSFMSLALFYYQHDGTLPQRSNDFLSHRYACYNTYETADRRYLSVGAVEPKFWHNLCLHLNIPQYIDRQYDERHQPEIIRCLRQMFKSKTLDHWMELLGDAETCVNAVARFDEVMVDPQALARGMVVDQTASGDPIRPTFGVPIKLSGTPGSVRTPPPEFGADTKRILQELGFCDREIATWAKSGVI